MKIGIKVKAIKFIGQDATGDTPAFEFARKGQVLLVIEDLSAQEDLPEHKTGYRYICQDLEKQYGKFCVKEDEVEIVVS